MNTRHTQHYVLQESKSILISFSLYFRDNFFCEVTTDKAIYFGIMVDSK